MRRLIFLVAALVAVTSPVLAQDTSSPEASLASAAGPQPADGRSVVAFALLPASVEGGVVREAMVGRMVDSVVMTVAGKPDIAAAWRVFVDPKDRVGIKVSTSGAPASSTHAAVISAVAAGLVASGVDAKNIVIWDRLSRHVQRAGYDSLARTYRVVSTEGEGYDKGTKIVSAVMGKLIIDDVMFAEKPGEQTSSTSHVSAVLAGVDKVVHVPALADSIYAGVQGAFSGMVLDNLDNWRRLARPPHYGDPYLPEIYSDPRIGGKVVLTILDALRPQYVGGPFPGPEFSVNYGAVFASRDPVALDATGLRLIDDFRKDAGLGLLAEKVKWPESAESFGLGRAAEDKIELVRTGLESEVRLPESP